MNKLNLLCLLSLLNFFSSCTSNITPAVIDKKSSVLIVNGMLGKQLVRIMVDTGARKGGSISSSIADKLSPIPGQAVKYAGANRQWKKANLYEIDNLNIGGVVLPPFKAIGLPSDHSNSKKNGYDISIGLPQLRNFTAKIDLKNHLFSLRPYRLDSKKKMPLKFLSDKKDCLLTSVDMHGKSYNMIFDTGAGTSTIEQKLLADIQHRVLENVKVISIDVAGVKRETYFVEIAPVCIDEICLGKHTFMPGPYRKNNSNENVVVDGIIGLPFWKDKVVLLDVSNGYFVVN